MSSEALDVQAPDESYVRCVQLEVRGAKVHSAVMRCGGLGCMSRAAGQQQTADHQGRDEPSTCLNLNQHLARAPAGIGGPTLGQRSNHF